MTSNKKRIRLSEIIGPAFYETHKLIDMGVIDEAVEAGGRASLKSSYVGTELVLQLLKHQLSGQIRQFTEPCYITQLRAA